MKKEPSITDLWLLLGGPGRKPAIIILDHLPIAIRGVAVTKRAWAVVAEFRLKPSRKLDLQLTERIYHVALEQCQLRRIGKRVWTEASQLLDCAIEVLGKIAVTAQCAF